MTQTKASDAFIDNNKVMLENASVTNPVMKLTFLLVLQGSNGSQGIWIGQEPRSRIMFSVASYSRKRMRDDFRTIYTSKAILPRKALKIVRVLPVLMTALRDKLCNL